MFNISCWLLPFLNRLNPVELTFKRLNVLINGTLNNATTKIRIEKRKIFGTETLGWSDLLRCLKSLHSRKFYSLFKKEKNCKWAEEVIVLTDLEFFLKVPKREACTQAPADLGCAGWNDKPLIMLSIKKHPDAFGNSHCPYGSVKNIESLLSYKR